MEGYWGLIEMHVSSKVLLIKDMTPMSVQIG